MNTKRTLRDLAKAENPVEELIAHGAAVAEEEHQLNRVMDSKLLESGAAPDPFDAQFRQDSRIRFQGPKWAECEYAYFRPAYEFGAKLARQERLADMTWTEVEGEASSGWTGENHQDWDNMREAIEYGFSRVRVG